MAEGESKSHLEQLADLVDKNWVQEVYNDLRGKHADFDNFDNENKLKLLLDFVLHTDLRHFAKRRFSICQEVISRREVDKGPSSKEGPYLVQVEEVQNIGLPIRSRYAASHKPNEKRMLRFKFFDGLDHVDAIEHKRLDIQAPKLGSKVLLKRIDAFPNGTLLLAPENCVFLGGCVNELEARQTCLHSILQAPAGGRRGPPLKLDEYIASVHDELERQVRDSSEAQRAEQQNGNDAPFPAPMPSDNPVRNGERQDTVQVLLEDGVEYESDSFEIEESPELEPPECLDSSLDVGQRNHDGPLLIEETEQPRDDGAFEDPIWDEPTTNNIVPNEHQDDSFGGFEPQLESDTIMPHAGLDQEGTCSGEKRSMDAMSKPNTPMGTHDDVLKSLAAMSETFAALKKRRASRE